MHLRQLRRAEEAEELEEIMDLQLLRHGRLKCTAGGLTNDPMVVLNHAEFKRIFRFSKAGILALVDLLYDPLHFDTDRGRPLSVLQRVLVALYHSSPAHISSCVSCFLARLHRNLPAQG